MKLRYPIILELILCCLKIYICVKMLLVLGWLKGITSILIYNYTSYFVLKLIGLEKINTNEILLLGTKPTEKFNCCCLFFIDNDFDVLKIKELLLQGLRKNAKMNKKLIQVLFMYFWQEVKDEYRNGVKVVSQVFNSREEIVEYAKCEVDNHIDLLEGLPYEFQILRYSNGGAVFFKVDHMLSDGLGMALFTTTLADGYSLDCLPTLLKINRKESKILKIIKESINLVTFPYYTIKLTLSRNILIPEPNPFSRKYECSGNTHIIFSDVFDFQKLHHVNRQLGITFNDLCLAIISAAFNKYSQQFPKRQFNYSKLVCAVPVGLKCPPRNTKEVQVSNDITGTLLSLKRISDPLTEYQFIAEEVNKTVKNNYNTSAWLYISTIADLFFPSILSKKLCSMVADTVDIAVSNLPGPSKEIAYEGNPIKDIIPMISIGFNKCFIILGTYNNRLRLSISIDKGLKIDYDKLIDCVNKEFEYIINKH
jgi:NRPS condensation-like uncharacterized protein